MKAAVGLLIGLSIAFTIFQFVNPTNTNVFVVVNRDGVDYGLLRLEFAGEGRRHSWERTIRIGSHPGTIRTVAISEALANGQLSLLDELGNQICSFELRPHGRYFQTIVIELQQGRFRIDERGVLHSDLLDRSKVITNQGLGNFIDP